MTSSKFPTPAAEVNDSGPALFMGGEQYYRQLDDLAMTICVAKAISDAQWLEFLDGTLRLASKIGRMPKVTIASFVEAYPNAKQRRQTTNFLRQHSVKPIDRLGLLSDSPLLRGAIIAFTWVVPKATVLAFESRGAATCLHWLHEVAMFDETRASTAWNEGRAALRVH